MGYENYKKRLQSREFVTGKFTLRDICYSDDAIENEINNLPPEHNHELWKNIKAVAEVFELVKVICNPTISSWYRCLVLNGLVGSKKLHHVKGYAIDFVTDDVERDYERLVKELPKYTRLIIEYKESEKKKWIHLEYNGINDKIHFRLDV